MEVPKSIADTYMEDCDNAPAKGDILGITVPMRIQSWCEYGAERK